MITALDHVVLLCPDLDAGVADYTTLFGAPPAWQAEQDGAATAVFSVQNTALELLAPRGTGAVADKLRNMVADGAKLTSLAYLTENIAETHRVLRCRGLMPGDVSKGRSEASGSSAVRNWHRFRIPDERVHGIKSFVIELISSRLELNTSNVGTVTRLDHLVIYTPNPERAAATYGARLGLRLALDRTAPEWKTRFLFFRLGGLTLEIIHRFDEDLDPSGPDALWGVTWAVTDLEAAHARLDEAGRDISEIRTGRKPGSRVFTVRDGTLGVPTLFIAHTPR